MKREDDYFRQEVYGVLLGRIKPEEEKYLLFFPYSKKVAHQIRAGVFVAVENFGSDEYYKRYSILQIQNAVPTHYALGPSAEKLETEYPGFVLTSLDSARVDWEQETPREETTQIRAVAIPIGVQLEVPRTSSDQNPSFSDDLNIPKQGAKAYLLNDQAIEEIMNRGLDPENTIEIGKLLDPLSGISLKVNLSELLKTHFGIFGFTKAGKSNLASEIIAKALKLAYKRKSGLRIVIIDYMNEYFPLLADMYGELPRSFLILLDLQPEIIDSLEKVKKGDVRAAEKLARTLLGQMIIPEILEDERDALISLLEEIALELRIKLYYPEELPAFIAGELHSIINKYERYLRTLVRVLRSYPEAISQLEEGDITPSFLRRLAQQLRDQARRGRFLWARPVVREESISEVAQAQTTLDLGTTGRIQTASAESDTIDIIDHERPAETTTGRTGPECAREMASRLEELAGYVELLKRIPKEARISARELVAELNDQKSTDPHLYVVLSDRVAELQNFLGEVGKRVYEERRRSGQNKPPILFMVDEADEFLEARHEGTEFSETKEKSREASELIARRGRKLGIAIGLATQRIAYLDTKLMGQLHTYFVSKLPRKTDRERVAEAFGVGIDIIDRTLSLRAPKQWMVMSHSSLGIPGTPYFANIPSAAERVRSWIEIRRKKRNSS